METGTVVLENDALLEFKSGEITTIDGELQLDGAKARVADAGATQQQQRADRPDQRLRQFLSAERRKGRDDRQFEPHRQRHVVSSTGPYTGGSGGTSLTIGGKLTNSSTNGYGVDIGNTGITSADTLTVNGTGGLSNTGSRSTSKAAPPPRRP